MLSTKVVRANAARPRGAGSAVTGLGCWMALAISAVRPPVTSDRRATETSVIALPPSSDLTRLHLPALRVSRPVLRAIRRSAEGRYAAQRRGEVAEWLKAAVSKTVMGGFVHRGFESLPLRQNYDVRTPRLRDLGVLRWSRERGSRGQETPVRGWDGRETHGL